MTAPALYRACASLIEDGEPGQLLTCISVTDLADVAPRLQELAARYDGRDDVVIELDTILTGAPEAARP